MPQALSKDFVEHVRTVHFSLVVVCLALLVISASDSAQDVRTARKQLKEIAEVTDESRWNEAYVARELSRQIASTPEVKALIQGRSTIRGDSDSRALAIAPEAILRFKVESRYDPAFLVRFDHPYFFGSLCCDEGKIFEGNENYEGFVAQGDTDVIRRPENLKDFKRVWDRLLKKELAYVPTTVGLLYPETTAPPFKSVKGTPYTVSATTSSVADGEVLWLGIPTIGGARGNRVNRYYVLRRPSRDQDGYVLPIIYFNEYRIRPQPILGSLHTDWKLTGAFSYAFAELDALTAATDTLPFSTIDSILADEEKRAVASFEAFGIKFPAGSTLQWGSLLILAAQLYLVMHISQLARRLQQDPEGRDVAWIGLYNTLTAGLVRTATMVFLPALSLAVLYLKTKHAPLTIGPAHFVAQSTALLLIVLIAIACSVAIGGRTLLLLRRLVTSQTPH